MNDRVELPAAREVCPTTTRRMLAEGALLVDVREIGEVAQLAFDVPGVLLMPLSELEQRFFELPRDRDLVLVCLVGQRSLKATYFLMYQGFTRVANMEGGLAKWVRKGFPIKGVRGETSAMDTASANSCCGAPAQAAAPTACCGGNDAQFDEKAAGGTCCGSPSAGGACC